jgi:hypothetical protein
VHEVLHKEATNMTAKKAALRAAYEEDTLRECTFAPKLVAEQIVTTGRVMKARICLAGGVVGTAQLAGTVSRESFLVLTPPQPPCARPPHPTGGARELLALGLSRGALRRGVARADARAGARARARRVARRGLRVGALDGARPRRRGRAPQRQRRCRRGRRGAAP